MHTFLSLQSHMHCRAHCPSRKPSSTRSPHHKFPSPRFFFPSRFSSYSRFLTSSPHLLSLSSSASRSFIFNLSTCFIRSSSPAIVVLQFRSPAELHDIVIEFRCVVTVSTPAVWLARENIKRLTPRPCINVEHSHGVVYMEECP